jgi:NTP pyrophosphatase (non-canonical NTP hydrolase)
MNFREYQEQAKTTAVYTGKGEFAGYAYCALGLAGEAGECANQVKKMNRDDHLTATRTRIAKIKHEIGDTLWYAAQLATELNLSLEEIAQENLEMLAERAAAGRLPGEGWKRGVTLPEVPDPRSVR